MANKPIIEIDVQDEKFQKFLKAYKEFDASLGHIPDSWKKLDQAIGKSGKKTSAIAKETAKAMGLSAAQAVKLGKAIKSADDSTKSLGSNAKKSASGFDHLKKSAEKAGNVVHRILGLTTKIGKISLGIAGIGGGAALWGIADLAGSAMRRQRSALGAGVSTGTMAAWNAYLSPTLGNPESLLNRIAIARQSPQDRWWLTQGAPNWQKHTISQNAASMLMNAQKFMKQYKSSHVALAAAGARGYLQAFDPTTLIRLQNMSQKQLMGEIHGAQAAAPGMGFSRATGNAWTGLSVQLHAAGVRIETALINALHPLAPAIRKLSNQIVTWIDHALGGGNAKKLFSEMAKGISGFAKYMGSKEFSQHVHNFMSALGMLAKETMAVAEHLKWILPSNESKAARMKSLSKAAHQNMALGSKLFGLSALGVGPSPAPHHHSMGGIIERPNGMEHPLSKMISQAILDSIAGNPIPVHVKVYNSTSARVDVMSHAAGRPQ